MQFSPFPLALAEINLHGVQIPEAAFTARDCRIPDDRRFLLLIYPDSENRICAMDCSDPLAPREIFRGKAINEASTAILSNLS